MMIYWLQITSSVRFARVTDFLYQMHGYFSMNQILICELVAELTEFVLKLIALAQIAMESFLQVKTNFWSKKKATAEAFVCVQK